MKIHLAKSAILTIALIAVVAGLGIISISKAASESVSGWAWSDNIGWVDMSGVSVESPGGAFSGHAWSDNVGWINFGANGCGESPILSLSSGTVTGFARAMSGEGRTDGFDGCIQLHGGQGVRLDSGGGNANQGNFSGYAWGGTAIGWVDFDGVFLNIEPILPPECPDANNPDCVDPPPGCPDATNPDCDPQPPECPDADNPACDGGGGGDGGAVVNLSVTPVSFSTAGGGKRVTLSWTVSSNVETCTSDIGPWSLNWKEGDPQTKESNSFSLTPERPQEQFTIVCKTANNAQDIDSTVVYLNSVTNAACNDGIDNDGDDLVDSDDPGCLSPADGDESDSQIIDPIYEEF